MIQRIHAEGHRIALRPTAGQVREGDELAIDARPQFVREGIEEDFDETG